MNYKNLTVWSRDMKLKGIATGSTKRCTLACCRGIRVATRWPDGKLTWPCSMGLEVETKGKGFKII